MHLDAGDWFESQDTTSALMLRFRAKIEQAKHILDLRGPIQSFVSLFGGDFHTCFTMGHEETLKPRNLYGEFDHKWPEHYYSHNYFYRDAALLKSLAYSNNERPVVWSEVEWKPHQVRVLREAQDKFELREGVVFPFKNQNSSISIFTVAGKKLIASPLNVAVLRDAMETAHIKALELLDNAETLPVPQMSPKTYAVFKLYVQGLSVSDIADQNLKTEDGEIFDLGTHGVKYHIKQIHRLLNTHTPDIARYKGLRYALAELFSGESTRVSSG